MALNAARGQPQNPLSVFFVSRYFYPFVGGLEKRVHHLACALAARGIRVTIVTSRISPDFPSEQILEGINMYRIASPRIKVVGACVFIAQLALFLFQRRSQYQVVHTFQVGHSSAATVLIGRLLKKPVFLSLSGGGSGGDVGRHVKTPWGLAFLALCRFASTIVVLNAHMQREVTLLMYPAARTACIPNGVDTTYYQPHPDRSQLRQEMAFPAKPIILYTGRLSAEKGIATLVRAFALLRSPSPALYIVGSGPEQQRLERIIQELCLDKTVVLLPACNDLRPYYQCADIFVMPSFHEGISNSVLEAMACALPVIATDVTGNTDLVHHRHNGLLVPPGDAPALAAALDELLGSPDTARDLGCRGQIIAQTKYCFDDMVERYCALYARLGS